MSDEVLVWSSVWSEVQIFCMRSNSCRCHPQTPSSLASFKCRLVVTSWYRLTHVVLEKRQLNGCSIVVVNLGNKTANINASDVIYYGGVRSEVAYIELLVGVVQPVMVWLGD